MAGKRALLLVVSVGIVAAVGDLLTRRVHQRRDEIVHMPQPVHHTIRYPRPAHLHIDRLPKGPDPEFDHQDQHHITHGSYSSHEDHGSHGDHGIHGSHDSHSLHASHGDGYDAEDSYHFSHHGHSDPFSHDDRSSFENQHLYDLHSSQGHHDLHAEHGTINNNGFSSHGSHVDHGGLNALETLNDLIGKHNTHDAHSSHGGHSSHGSHDPDSFGKPHSHDAHGFGSHGSHSGHGHDSFGKPANHDANGGHGGINTIIATNALGNHGGYTNDEQCESLEEFISGLMGHVRDFFQKEGIPPRPVTLNEPDGKDINAVTAVSKEEEEEDCE